MHIPWHWALADEDIDNSWLTWTDLLAAVDDCIPRVNAKKKPDAPWISKKLISLCRKKKAAYRNAWKTGKDRDMKYYKKLNTMVKRNCNSACWKYINDLTEKLKRNDAKPFWRYINSKHKGSNNLVLLEVGNKKVTDDQDIAENMNAYFSSVFTEESFKNFSIIDRKVDAELCDIECTTVEVEMYLKNLSVNKSPGSDNISPRILKECASQLAPPLTSLFNTSFYSGMHPVGWKMANICPIHKKKLKLMRENY